MNPSRSSLIALLVVLIVLALGLALWRVVGSGGTDTAAPASAGENASSTPSDTAATGSDTAAARLYDALAKAASEPRVQVAMYRETYANAADADSRRNPGSIASSVSELDTENGKFRSVLAHNYLHHPGFTVGRCMDGTTYNDDYGTGDEAERATSLEGIAGHLRLRPKGHLYEVTQPLTYIPKQVSAADLFTVQDEGMVEKGRRQLRRLSFAPTRETGVNRQLYDTFYEVAQIAQIEAEQPAAGWQHGFGTRSRLAPRVPGMTGTVPVSWLAQER